MILPRVLFPAPFSPIKAWIEPFSNCTETLSRARTPGNVLEIFSADKKAINFHGFDQKVKRTRGFKSGYFREPRVEAYLIGSGCLFLRQPFFPVFSILIHVVFGH